MDMPERFRELSSWLAATDIAWLELKGPGTLLRLRRGAKGVERVAPAADTVVAPGAGVAEPTVVRSPRVGVLRHRHPLQEAPLAAEGQSVVAGQALVLLQIGPTLVPAAAPRDGVVARIVVHDGEAVGYGHPLVELL